MVLFFICFSIFIKKQEYNIKETIKAKIKGGKYMAQLFELYLFASLVIAICYEIKMEVIKEYRKYRSEDDLYYMFGKNKEKYFNCMYIFFPSIIFVKLFSFLTSVVTKQKIK